MNDFGCATKSNNIITPDKSWEQIVIEKCLPLLRHLLTAEGRCSLLIVVMLPNQIIWCEWWAHSDFPVSSRMLRVINRQLRTHSYPVCLQNMYSHTFKHMFTELHLFSVLFCLFSYIIMSLFTFLPSVFLTAQMFVFLFALTSGGRNTQM